MRIDDTERINAYELEAELRTGKPRQRKEWSGEAQWGPPRLQPGCSTNMMMKSVGGACGTCERGEILKGLW